MGIEFDGKLGDGLAKLTVTGVAGRTEHAVAIELVRDGIRAGWLKALFMDASAAEIPANPSLSREVWEDYCSELGSRPIAYLPPEGHFEPVRQAMIADLLHEWECRYTAVTNEAEGLAWCRAQLDAPGSQ